MRAIVQTGPESVDVSEREPPAIGPEEARVAVHATGVCGSDAHAYRYHGGYEWVQLPRVMGHEYAGVVESVGESVTEVEPGDRVVEDPTRRCGQCFQCRNGQENVCAAFSVKGMHRDGSYADRTVAHPENLHVVPDGVPLEHAAITEPLSVAARAVYEQSVLTPGDTALVEGPGPIGVLVATVADALGADVTVSGLGADTAYRLPLVERLGIDAVNLDETDLGTVTAEATDGVGFDVVFDTTGHRSGIETAVERVRKGGQIVVVGLPGEASEVALSDLVRSEVQVETSYGSVWRDFERALSLLDAGTVAAAEIVDTSFSPADPETAFETFLDSETCKPVFTFAAE
ncbi:alcohol dehydrogenase catalytic domain-containing protein [Halosimplex litoreum]|uniref:Alcohol dehydrogenase catalytic domain-containing protein n=1 Tax=Halosimplex litoreum TaxID=1198301 RepID=A0A7T3KV44_9EURY|nr:alcohol dehydrogenase catalytic domain-containing protein [Halosimplex litoreum]QPV62445.1 alcohol dehydrogenase catalytic domain-containing protein [Halosimplex litoreum]